MTKFLKKTIQSLVILSLVFAVSCKKEKENPLAIGMKYQGGIIAYIDATGEHGLIAASEDQSEGIAWDYNNYNDFVATDATGTAIGTGQSNTTKIVAALGAGNYAAKICNDLVLNGYDDWFLPSTDELILLYQNRDLIGGFNSGTYWSSTEDTESHAYNHWFTYNIPQSGDKYGKLGVRAIRAF